MLSSEACLSEDLQPAQGLSYSHRYTLGHMLSVRIQLLFPYQERRLLHAPLSEVPEVFPTICWLPQLVPPGKIHLHHMECSCPE